MANPAGGAGKVSGQGPIFREAIFIMEKKPTGSFILLGLERDCASVLFGDLPYLGILPKVPQLSTKFSPGSDFQMIPLHVQDINRWPSNCPVPGHCSVLRLHSMF